MAAAQEMPRVRFVASVVFVVSTAAFLYLVLPKLLGLQDTWTRIHAPSPPSYT